MSYLRGGARPDISQEVVELLAGLARMPLPPEDIASLAAALGDQLGVVELFDRLDLEDVQPALWFDPRWHD